MEPELVTTVVSVGARLTVLMIGAIVVQSLGFTMALYRMHKDSMKAHRDTQEILERMETYRLVERK